MCKRTIFPVLFPDPVLVCVGDPLFEKPEDYPRNNKEPSLAGLVLGCIILGTVPSHRQLGEAHVITRRVAVTGSSSRNMPGPGAGWGGSWQKTDANDNLSESYGRGALMGGTWEDPASSLVPRYLGTSQAALSLQSKRWMELGRGPRK